MSLAVEEKYGFSDRVMQRSIRDEKSDRQILCTSILRQVFSRICASSLFVTAAAGIKVKAAAVRLVPGWPAEASKAVYGWLDYYWTPPPPVGCIHCLLAEPAEVACPKIARQHGNDVRLSDQLMLDSLGRFNDKQHQSPDEA